MKKKLLPLLVSLIVASPVFGEDLSQVYALAKENDPQLMAARAERDSALEARPQAKAALLPNISLTGNANRTRRDVESSPSGASKSTYGTSQLQLKLSQPIYHRDYWIQLEQADKQIAQAETGFAVEEQGLIVR
ncbi:MAG: TolC family protein, partial [Candidatus Sedimenticola sp. 6PFRAG7]